MKPIAPIHRRLVEEKAPRFARAVQMARLLPSEQRVPVMTSLDDFPDQDMALVYACLWYARTEGIAVRFEPRADY